MESAYLKIPWKFGDNTPKLSITKVFSLNALCKSFHNAFSILGRARATLRRNGMADRIEEFTNTATSGDYQKLIATCCEWFDVQ